MNDQPTNLPATRQQRQIIEVQDPVPILDTARFEHMQRIATIMARSSLIPDSLYTSGTGSSREVLPMEQVIANCFLIVNQAVRWNYDPFAVAQCVSVIHGKLCYEGKLVDAVLETKLGIDLDPEYVGTPSDGDAYGIKLSGEIGGKIRTVEGMVGDWKTLDKNGNIQKQWKGANAHRQLAYRATREWARLYAPAVMLGVYTPDEMDDLSEHRRARNARQIALEPPDPNVPEEKPEPIYVPLSKQGQGRHDEQQQEGGEAQQSSDTPVQDPASVADSEAGDDDALLPLDDPGDKAAEWITFFPHADTGQDLRDYATDEAIFERIAAGDFDEATAAAINRAYNAAIDALQPPQEMESPESPDPNA